MLAMHLVAAVSFATLFEIGIYFDESNVLLPGRPIEELLTNENQRSSSPSVGGGKNKESMRQTLGVLLQHLIAITVPEHIRLRSRYEGD